MFPIHVVVKHIVWPIGHIDGQACGVFVTGATKHHMDVQEFICLGARFCIFFCQTGSVFFLSPLAGQTF